MARPVGQTKMKKMGPKRMTKPVVPPGPGISPMQEAAMGAAHEAMPGMPGMSGMGQGGGLKKRRLMSGLTGMFAKGVAERMGHK